MRGYTAKVGLRKPPFRPWASVVLRVQYLWACHDLATVAGDTAACERIRGDINEALGIERGWLTLSERYPEHFRRRRSIEDARARVASIPESHRRYLENEFLRAEADARAILRANGPTQ